MQRVRVVVLGDSLVGDGDVEGAFTKALKLAGLKFDWMGRKGWTVKKYLVAFAGDEVEVDFDGATVLVVLGTNDSVEGNTGEFAANYHALAYRLRERGARNVLWVTPTRYAGGWFEKATQAVEKQGLTVWRPKGDALTAYPTSAMHPSVSNHTPFAKVVAQTLNAGNTLLTVAKGAAIAAGGLAVGLVYRALR